MSANRIMLELTNAEALVLFEWLARVDAAGKTPVDHPSEQHVLWKIEGQLEKQLSEPLDPNYRELVERARAQVQQE